MRYDRAPRVIAIRESSPEEFEKRFTERMDEIEGCKILGTEYRIEQDTFSAIVSYEIVKQTEDSVADEFHNEGIKFCCRECPYHAKTTDRRKKWVECKYSPSGITHLDRECCELFYVNLKQHMIEPIS